MISTILRSFATTAAGVWLGAMILIAIVAQTTFSEMRQTGVSQPNAVAGRIMAKNFSKFDRIQWVCAALLVGSQVGRIALGERSKAEWVRLALMAGAASLFLYSAMELTPQIVNLQSEVAGVDAEAAAKAAFDSFHESSVRIAKINLVLVLAIVLSLATHRRPTTPEAVQ